MKKPLSLVGAALVAVMAGYWGTRWALPLPEKENMTAEAKLDWLEDEFDLRPEGAAAVRLLQKAYAPVCEQHCADIARAQTALAAAGDDALARAAARTELERLKQVCAEATHAHLAAVASHMAPEQAARFMAMMEPRIAHHAGRSGAPGLTRDGAP